MGGLWFDTDFVSRLRAKSWCFVVKKKTERKMTVKGELRISAELIVGLN